jgi:mannosyltransferase
VETATASAHPEALQARHPMPSARLRALVRSRTFWIGLAIAGGGVALRFSTLGLQSYHHDEVITAARVLPGSFGHMLHEVHRSESTPWLYYVIAWAWSKAFGLGEVGLRSLSALFGAATIPVAYLIGRELAGRRAGLIAMALVAVNPMLIWYSQEARAYSLLVLLCAVSLLFFLRFRRRGGGLDLALWAGSSALALTSHYFAAFPIAVEAVWLLAASRPRRRVLLGVAGIAAAGLLLAPLALHQADAEHATWIVNSSLSDRIEDAGYSVFIGETGKVIGASAPREGYAAIPAVLVAAIVALALARGGIAERRGAGIALTIGLGAVALALGLAAVGQDYVLARNLIAALVPLLAAIAAAAAGIRMRRTGIVLVAALCAYWLAFAIRVDTTAGLQRPDWRQIAARLGQPRHPRAIVTWTLGTAPLRLYLHDGSQRFESGGGPLHVPEVDLVTKRGDVRAPDRLEKRFPYRKVIPLGRFTVISYRAPHAVSLGRRVLRGLPTGFGSNAVMVDGANSLTFGPLPRRRALPGLTKRPELVAKEIERHRQRHRERLGLQPGHVGRHEKLQSRKVHHQGRKADRKEARRLEAGRP